MKEQLLTINRAAKMLGVSIQTLRRWDSSGRLLSVVRKNTKHRRYFKNFIEDYIRNNLIELNIFKMARNWVADNSGQEPFSDFYCQDIYIFQTRLNRLEKELSQIQRLKKIFPLISAVVGEIGSNSFDHNLGNWSDIRGIFFAWDLNKGKIVLADRGQGILKTLKNVKSELKNHQEALLVAFTEIISGRAPENRGNGLKFVKEIISSNKIDLFFQTGDAWLKIPKNNSKIKIEKSALNLRGCLALIKAR